MNNLLLIIGMLALSNGNVSLLDSKNKSINQTTSRKTKKIKKDNTKNRSERVRKKKSLETDSINDIFKFNMNDINKGLKLLELSDEDLDRGMEIITRTKKYMSKDEKKVLIKLESVLDLVKGIKKLSAIDISDDLEESEFFRSMEEEDKKNMMIREILEVFPDKRKESFDKAVDMKKKIDLFAELFLPDDFGEGGFSLSSLADISNLGSVGNLKLLGSLLRGDDDLHYDDEEIDNEDEDNYEEFEKYEYIDIDEYD